MATQGLEDGNLHSETLAGKMPALRICGRKSTQNRSAAVSAATGLSLDASVNSQAKLVATVVFLFRSMAKPKSIPKLQQFLVRWTPFGCTAGLTIHSVLNSNLSQAVLLAFGTGVTSLWVAYSESFMAEAEQEAEKLGGKSAQWFFQLIYRLVGRLQEWLVQVWWAVTFNFKGKYYKRLDILCRDFETKGMTLDKVLSLQNIFVAVHLSPKNLVNVSPNLLKRDITERLEQDLTDREIGHYLAQMPKYPGFRRLAILGAPGSGKTTLMRYLALMYAARKPHRLHPKAPQFLPVLLYLRDIYEEILTKPEITLSELLTEWVQRLQRVDPLELPKNWFAQQLRQGKCLVLLDGLDEVANTSHRQAVSRWVDQQMYDYPDTPFILTSRRLGYEEAQLKQTNVQVLEVEPLNSRQIKRFVHNWYTEVERSRRGGQDDLATQDAAYQQTEDLLRQVQAQSALKALATNPLLLTLIATAHQQNQSIPLKRVELYQTICEVMLGKRQEAKGLRPELSIREKLSVLQPLALAMMQQKTRTFKQAAVEQLFTEYLSQLSNPPQPSQFLKDLQAVDALIAKEKEGDYEFAHLSFQEYLAAVEVQMTQQQEILLSALADAEKLSWWAETMRLYAAQTDASRLVEAIVQEPTVETVLLAWDFYQEGRVGDAQRQALREFSNEPLKILEAEDYGYAEGVQPRYFALAHYLQTGQWKRADYETYAVMDRVMGGWSLQGIKEFPCPDLRVIDQLWLKYSQGKFGFSVQKQIWVEVGGKLDYAADRKAAVAAWRKLHEVVNWSTIRYELGAPEGHLPGVELYLLWEGSLLSHPGL